MSKVFIIDQSNCIACGACAIACKDRLNLPDELNALRIEQIELGSYPAPKVRNRVMHCFHCLKPACLPSCPVNAIRQETDGTVQIDEETCIACGKCVKACPFGTIALIRKSRAVKCDACRDETDAGRLPICVRACPMRTLGYGDPAGFRSDAQADPDFNGLGLAPRLHLLR